MVNKNVTLTFLVFMLLVACSPMSTPDVQEPPTEGPLQFDPNPPAQLKPGDALHLQGSGSALSESFSLSEDCLVRVTWNMIQGNDFTLVVRSTEDEAESIQFTIQNSPGEGSGDWIFKAGEYVVDVVGEGSQWELDIELVENMESPFNTPQE